MRHLLFGVLRVEVLGVPNARRLCHLLHRHENLGQHVDGVFSGPGCLEPIRQHQLALHHRLEHRQVTVTRACPQPGVDHDLHIRIPETRVDLNGLLVVQHQLARLFLVLDHQPHQLAEDLGPAPFGHVAGDKLNLRIRGITLVLRCRRGLVLQCLGVKGHRLPPDARTGLPNLIEVV